MKRISQFAAAAWLAATFITTALADNAFLEGYSDYSEFTERVQALEASPIAQVRSLLTTKGKREVFLIEIGDAKDDSMKPAILVVGNVHAPHVLGSELALRFAEQLIADKDTDKVKAALKQCRYFIIPRPAPDATEKALTDGSREITGNNTPTDDDRDNEIGEDGPEDLNGDGWITQFRVKRNGGAFQTHPDDARLMVKANAQKNEPGEYDVYTEGIDNDKDESWNEDASDGVNLNRNFPFAYPAYEKAAGPHACSELTSRALADFAYDHPEIQLVFTFSPQDNTFKPWKGDGKSDGSRIKTKIHSADAPFADLMAERMRDAHGGKDAPASASSKGSFVQWAYFHYGRWSLSSRGWWIPKTKLPVKEKGDDTSENPAEKADEDSKPGGESKKKPAKEETSKEKPKADGKESKTAKPAQPKKDNDELNALRWMEANHVDGFVPWKEIKHPDFPDQTVEVGGFKPFWRLNPPAEELESLGKKHSQFLVGLSELLPKLAIEETKTESLGGGLYRITAKIANTGYLPTTSRMGAISRQTYPIQVHLELPDTTKLLYGSPRRSVSRIEGSGGSSELTWMVQLNEEKPLDIKLRAWSISVGNVEKMLKIGETK